MFISVNSAGGSDDNVDASNAKNKENPYRTNNFLTWNFEEYVMFKICLSDIPSIVLS